MKLIEIAHTTDASSFDLIIFKLEFLEVYIVEFECGSDSFKDFQEIRLQLVINSEKSNPERDFWNIDRKCCTIFYSITEAVDAYKGALKLIDEEFAERKKAA